MAKIKEPYRGPIVTRDDARSVGANRFFTGVPCLRGHIAQRRVSQGHCIPCAAEAFASWKTRNPGKAAAAHIAWKVANPSAADIATQRWRKANPEKVAAMDARRDKGTKRATDKRSRAKRRDKVAAKNKQWRDTNSDHLRAYHAEWRIKNPDKVRAKVSARRARKAAAGGSHTASEIRSLFKAQKGKCAYSRICGNNLKATFHVDHITALSRGGSNKISNIQLTCPACNTAKGARDPIDHANRLGLLI